jgi:hypothetical protein
MGSFNDTITMEISPDFEEDSNIQAKKKTINRTPTVKTVRSA